MLADPKEYKSVNSFPLSSAKEERAMPPQRRGRRSHGDRLREAVLALADHKAQVLEQGERAWASITFSGARHHMTLYFSGEDAMAAGENFIASLPDHEFALPNQLVADATIIEAEHRMHPSPRLIVRCEMLLLEDS